MNALTIMKQKEYIYTLNIISAAEKGLQKIQNCKKETNLHFLHL